MKRNLDVKIRLQLLASRADGTKHPFDLIVALVNSEPSISQEEKD